MNVIAERVLVFLKRVIAQDSTLVLSMPDIRDISVPQSNDNRGVFIFTLPDLHRLLLTNDRSLGQVAYKEFRSELYSSNINAQLESIGFCIELFHSSKKIDTSYYQLMSIK